jgi:uncharacterized protein (DUF924 family)
MDKDTEEILDFWLNEAGEKGWYAPDAAQDARIRERWLPLWERGRKGELSSWTVTPEGTLALLILLDQFPRNMFRGEARAFASDARALAVAKAAILRGFDKKVPLPQRQFFYLPLMHSEVQTNQDKGVRLVLLSFGRGEMLRHARAHRDVIREFGRFPYRNAALGRVTSPEEQAFLDRGGYVAALNATAP